VLLRVSTTDDEPFLWEMLAQAAEPAGGMHPDEVMADDHLRRYLDGWGRAGDIGLVAWDGATGGERIGASWLRLMPPERPGYGFVDAATPEIAVAVVDGHRGRGIGRALMVGALDVAAALGHPQVSLSVALTNERAATLYRALGFVDVAPDDGGSMTMLAPTAPAPPQHDPTTAPLAHLAGPHDGPALARLRRVMLDGMGATGDDDGWVASFVRMWPEEQAAGRWVAAVATAPDDRPVASALAVAFAGPPAPGRPEGRVAQVGSVATEPGWRRRGAARATVGVLLDVLDERGVESSTLSASPDGADLYRSLGFRPGDGRSMRRNATNR
jgi:ribosomal protein S18 acetylase RimI-like enzyme